MQYFLEELSHRILTKYSYMTGELCVVTPNRRAGLFLRKHIASNVTKPLWAPEILSIEDFINKISGLTIIDKMALMFEFYSVYTNVEKDNAEDVDSFLSWAPSLLADFEDVDAAMADRHKLYEYLTDLRYIDTWNPDGSPLTAFQQQYLSFIKKIKIYHENLADHLLNKNMAWQSLSSRMVAEKLQEDGEVLVHWERIVFAGFNALTQAEEMIISKILKQGNAEYIADSDPYYVKDTGHEAGRFIRKYSKKFSISANHDQSSYFKNNAKNIWIYGVARNVNQARLAGNLINDLPGLTADENTAMVLANEALLIPALNALPAKIKEINVTMGYPINKTKMYGFFDSLFQLFVQASGRGEEPGLRFYHKDIIRFFSNGLCGLLWDMNDGTKQTTLFVKAMTTMNKSFFTYDDLVSISGSAESFTGSFGFLNGIDAENNKTVLQVFLDLTVKVDHVLRKKAAEQGGDIVQTSFFVDFESLYYFARIFRKLLAFVTEFSFPASVKTLYRLFKQSGADTRLSFTGEPLQGLQVMGMLETRCLDFKNIVLLSVNENILPKAKSMQSFIPFEVKKSFGMRDYQEQDAIYAYHFYRLLQRAENIIVLYNTQTEDVGSSEKSRFVTQLQYELPRYNPRIKISEKIVSIPAKVGSEHEEITIAKSEDIMQRLLGMAEKGFSPSALSMYIRCPLQFYFEKVVLIEETAEIQETLEASTIGSIVHDVLDHLYKPYEGEFLKPPNIGEMFSRLNNSLDQTFEEYYSRRSVLAGKNLLLFHLIKRYIENILSAEKKFLEKIEKKNQVLVLLGMEQMIHGELHTNDQNGNVLIVNLRGKADRIDRLGGLLRIIDYKTGKLRDQDLKFEDWSEPFSGSDKDKVFQLLCYAWMYHKQHPEEKFIEAGIISSRNPSKQSQTLKFPGGNGALSYNELLSFEEHLHALVSKIMNSKVAFSQATDKSACVYCAFKTVCNRL